MSKSPPYFTENSALLSESEDVARARTPINTPLEKQNMPVVAAAATGFCSGIINDLKNRSKCYKSDWTDHLDMSLLAPSTYIFFASVIPALTFGEQLADDTGDELGGAQVLQATAICGVIQAIFGGQPLLIVGVAEPIILIYGFMHAIAVQNDIPYRAWCTVTLWWTSAMLLVLAVTNCANYIHSFTRFSGELFGMLIALLFLQQGIKGVVQEFGSNNGVDVDPDADEAHWRLFNGTWAVVLALGLVWTCFLLRGARSWVFFTETVRGFLCDYSTALMVVGWSALSYVPKDTPKGIPRRLLISDAFDEQATVTWSTVDTLGELELWHIFAAIAPAVIITILFFFDHNVSAQLAQIKEFNLEKQSAYHWDLVMIAIMTLICGTCGLPPVNGVLPQAPMHTKACAVLADDGNGGKTFVVREQRWTNLLQSLMCSACIFAQPALKTIPRSVLWGFFIFMGLESLNGSQFWDRLQLLITQKSQLPKLTTGSHNVYLETVPYSTIRWFTACQLFGFLACYGITWAGDAGIAFPVLIMLLVPLRIRLLPKFFNESHLTALDPLETDEASIDVPDTPSKGTVAQMVADAKTSTSVQDIMGGQIKGGGMYPQGLGAAASRLPSVATMTAIVNKGMTIGNISEPEGDHIIETAKRAAELENSMIEG
eukprot:m.152971 g.152971  ORF g.152971 m.152971 type:complete len:657 (-) comp30821_c1_seq1:41-2011(-)